MKKLIIAVAAFFTLSAFSEAGNLWKNDSAHSQPGFTVTHLGINDVSGTFNDFNVAVESTKPDFSDAKFQMTAQVASIDTRVDARDNHLKSADFFDAEKYPTMDFKSTGVKKAGKNKYKMTGNLKLHGVTKPVSMDLIYTGSTQNPMNKKTTVGFQVAGVIKRSEFNIGEKFPAPMISDEVRIKADGEFAQ